MRTLLTVPGNLLIAGEYTVLEPGGLGLAVALEARVVLSAEPSPTLAVTGSTGCEGEPFGPDDPERGGILRAALQVAFQAGAPDRGKGLTIHVDSSAFHRGSKIGLGSSAAVAVALTAALLASEGGPHPEPDRVFETALRAHRAFQAGSGYDVAASVHGGCGLFVGGVCPTWEPRDMTWLRGAYLFRGEAPVRTPHATARYKAWRERAPEEARRHRERSNPEVRALLGARTAQDAARPLRRLADLGVEIGDRIGVSAVLPPPPGASGDDWICKALGAGNEIGLLVPLRPGCPTPEGAWPLRTADRGIVWS